jgi:hypothetical protein
MKLKIPFEFQVATMCKDFLDEVLQVVAACNIKWIRRRWIEVERFHVRDMIFPFLVSDQVSQKVSRIAS